jgi:uncharacterized OB-fold protein
MTTPMLPHVDASNDFFWNGAQEHKLVLLCCESCGHFVHLPRPVCSNCQSMKLSGKQLSGKATLYSYTVANKAFHPYYVDKIPYLIATVELVEQPGLKLQTNLVDVDEKDLTFDMELEVDFRPLGDSFLVPVFKPAGGAK